MDLNRLLSSDIKELENWINSLPLAIIEKKAVSLLKRVLKDIDKIAKDTGWSRDEIIRLLKH